jgi:hypothetical protein
VERSGCDVRTSINTLQLLARQAAATAANNSASSQGRPRVRITAAAVSSSGAFGLKDVSRTPLGVLNELLVGSSKAMAARLQQLAAAAMPKASGGRAGGSSGAAPGRAAVAARLQLQEHYNMLLDLGEHELVGGRRHLVGSGAGDGKPSDAAQSTAGRGAARWQDRLQLRLCSILLLLLLLIEDATRTGAQLFTLVMELIFLVQVLCLFG